MQKIIEALPKIEIKNQNAKHTIVFVHGFSASFDVHEDFYFKYKKTNYYSISLPGNNLLPATNDQLSVEYYAELIIYYIKLRKLKNVILIGHSMGGGVISLVAQQIPNLISKIIYVAPINKASLDLLRVVFKEYFIPNTREDPIKILGRSLPNLELMNKLEKCLDNLKIPTLLILGENDGVIDGAKSSAYFKEHVKDLEVSIIPNVGHMVFIENPDLYIKIVDKFINK